MNHIHCINRKTGSYISHFDNTETQIGVVVRDGRMEETVRIHRAVVIVGMSHATLVVHTSLEDNAFIAYKLTPLSVDSNDDMLAAERCSSDFIQKNFIH